jgi:hypothetical protein
MIPALLAVNKAALQYKQYQKDNLRHRPAKLLRSTQKKFCPSASPRLLGDMHQLNTTRNNVSGVKIVSAEHCSTRRLKAQ